MNTGGMQRHKFDQILLTISLRMDAIRFEFSVTVLKDQKLHGWLQQM